MTDLPDKAFLAMIALKALPGSPLYAGSVAEVLDSALEDLQEYKAAGVDAVILENDFDVPYIKPPIEPVALEAFAEVAKAVRAEFSGPLGLQFLEGANLEALELAVNAKFNFIRVESYVYAHVGGAGILEGCAGRLLRKRKALAAEDIKVFADIKKKHCSHAMTADLSIIDELRQSELFLVDGHVVTGIRTGQKPDLAEVEAVSKKAKKAVFIGSGMTAENLQDYLPHVNGIIVGSDLREGGEFLAALSKERLLRFVDSFKNCRTKLLS